MGVSRHIDAARITSLSQAFQTDDHSAMVHGVTLPKVCIDNQPSDFEYVKIAA